MTEAIKNLIYNSLKFGITVVRPNRAIKNCRIRKLLIEYYINDFTTILVIPSSCSRCPKINDCTEEFILQILEKVTQTKKEGDESFIL